MIKTVRLKESDITKRVQKDFTISYQQEYSFTVPELNIDFDFNIGFITGTSGSGKSLLLKQFGTEEIIEWFNDDAVCSHFNDYDDAVERLQAVGFNTVPQWLLPRRILSQGQGYRVDLARAIKSNIVRDEFTSTIDRSTAMGLCNSLQRYIRAKNLTNIVFAGVHQDIIPFLKPDWIYNTDNDTLTISANCYDILDLDKKVLSKKPFMEVNYAK